MIALLVRKQKTDLAIEITSAAIRVNPQNQNLAERYLDLVASEGPEQEVARVFDELEALFPTDVVIPLRRARWLSRTGQADEAQSIFVRLLKSHPLWYDLHHAYGRFFLRLEKWADAKKEFEIALTLHKGHQMAHEGKALALRGLAAQAEEAGKFGQANGYVKKAETHFRSAIYWAGINLKPTARFYTSIGWFYLDQGRAEEALFFFEAAMAEAPEHFPNYWGKGAALKLLGRPAEAIMALEVALSKAPQPLESPAKEAIPHLLEKCKKDLGTS